MKPNKQGVLGGLPLTDWMGRRVQLLRLGVGRPSTGTLVGLVGQRQVRVRLPGGKVEIVDRVLLHPWWAQNPDLQKKSLQLLKEIEMVSQRKHQPEVQPAAKPHVEEKPAPVSTPAPVTQPVVEKRKLQRLTQMQFFQLCRWFEMHRAELESVSHTRQQLRDQISGDLKLTIGDSTQREAEQATGVKTKVLVVRKHSIGAIQIVARAVASLYEQMGVALPEDLQHLISSDE